MRVRGLRQESSIDDLIETTGVARTPWKPSRRARPNSTTHERCDHPDEVERTFSDSPRFRRLGRWLRPTLDKASIPSIGREGLEVRPRFVAVLPACLHQRAAALEMTSGPHFGGTLRFEGGISASLVSTQKSGMYLSSPCSGC